MGWFKDKPEKGSRSSRLLDFLEPANSSPWTDKVASRIITKAQSSEYALRINEEPSSGPAIGPEGRPDERTPHGAAGEAAQPAAPTYTVEQLEAMLAEAKKREQK